MNELGRRANNEDHISPVKGTATLEENLFIVCDGVGGEKRGEIASEIACRSVREYIGRHAQGRGNAPAIIQQAVQHACAMLAEYASTDILAKRMSTTLALALLGEHSIFVAWCGDTRIHHIRNGRILWKSKDHSLVGELIRMGELTEEEALHHPKRNIITRSLNASGFNCDTDLYEIDDFRTGDYLLLCTDGFLEKINERLICEVLLDEAKKDKSKWFLSLCQGTCDNFSMYLLRGRHLAKSGKPVSLIKMLLLAFFLLLALFCITVVISKYYM